MMTNRQHPAMEEADGIVEQVCSLGCGRVYQIIDRLDSGEAVPELNGVAPDIQKKVHHELKSIMSVYDAREGGAACKLDTVPE